MGSGPLITLLGTREVEGTPTDSHGQQRDGAWVPHPTQPPFQGPLTRWMARPPTAINVNKKMSRRPGILAQIGHPGFWLKSGTRDFGSNRAPGSAQNKTPP